MAKKRAVKHDTPLSLPRPGTITRNLWDLWDKNPGLPQKEQFAIGRKKGFISGTMSCQWKKRDEYRKIYPEVSRSKKDVALINSPPTVTSDIETAYRYQFTAEALYREISQNPHNSAIIALKHWEEMQKVTNQVLKDSK